MLSVADLVDVEVLAQLLEAIQVHPWPTEPIIDYCGDYTCTPETCTDMSDDDRARSRAWTAFNKATPTLVASLLAELESVRGELRLHQQQRAAALEICTDWVDGASNGAAQFVAASIVAALGGTND